MCNKMAQKLYISDTFQHNFFWLPTWLAINGLLPSWHRYNQNMASIPTDVPLLNMYATPVSQISQFQRINIPISHFNIPISHFQRPGDGGYPDFFMTNIPKSSWISRYPSFREAISQYPRKNRQYPNIPDWVNRALSYLEWPIQQSFWDIRLQNQMIEW